MKKFSKICLALFLLVVPPAFSQTYFRLIEHPLSSYYQRIACFPDGSVLVADHIQNAPKNEFYLAKFDACGELVWAKYYPDNGEKLLFDAIEINESGDIFIMGTEIKGTFETLFLMKLNANGDVERYRHFPGEWLEIFTYSMSWRDGKIMVSGLLFYPGNVRKGHIAVFDENLQPLWSRQYEPFDAYGESILTSDGGVLNFWGGLLIKTNSQGQVQWSKNISSNFSPTLSRPIETADGYVFDVYENGFSSLFRINKNGGLDWQTAKFPASYSRVDVFSQLPDGEVLLVYSCPDASGSVPCQLRVTPAGKIHQQNRLQVAYPLNTGFVYHRLDDSGVVHVFGNAQMNFNSPDNKMDFLAQFPLDGPTGECLNWEPFEETAPNDVPVTISLTTVSVSDAPLNVLDQPIPLLQDLNLVTNEICELSAISAIVRSDTLLPCHENWPVSLPDTKYVWEDGFPTSARSLTVPGTYRANKITCQDTLILEFNLEKKMCGCDVFLPNAISPNGDGLNDELRPYSNCTILEWKIAVYDRWGGRVFESDDQNLFWDGNRKGKTLTQGVYVAKINYKLVDRFGEEQAGELVQDFTVTK